MECAALEGDALQRHVARLNLIAVRQHTPAIVITGEDPGALPILRYLFLLLIPKGHTETFNRPGVSLHHSSWLRELTGVKNPLCTELQSARSRSQLAEAAYGQDFIAQTPVVLGLPSRRAMQRGQIPQPGATLFSIQDATIAAAYAQLAATARNLASGWVGAFDDARVAVCCCLFGRLLSSTMILSMMDVNASSFGRTGGFVRT